MLSNFEIDQRARKCFQASLPEDWIASSPADDVGLDYWVQVTSHGLPTGLGFFVQLKGTTQVQPSDALSYSLSTDRLHQYLACPLPILFVYCSVSLSDRRRDIAYWCWIRDYVREQLDSKEAMPDWWQGQETISIRLSRTAVLDALACQTQLLLYIRAFHERHTNQEDKYLTFFHRCFAMARAIRNFDTFFTTCGVDRTSDIGARIKQYFVAGRLYQDDSKHREAVGYFLKAQAVMPTPTVCMSLAFSYMELDDLGAALAALDQGLELEPSDSLMLSNKGTLLFRVGRFEEGYDYHERAVMVDPKEPYLWLNAAATLEYLGTESRPERVDHFLQRALAFYQRALELSPTDDFILAEMGLVLTKMYDFRHAARVLEQAVQLNPRNVPALRRLAGAYVMLHENARALLTFDRLTQLGVETEYVQRMKKMLDQD